MRKQVLWFAWQDVQSNLQVYVDTDYAGCPRTRRSTNGGLVMHGSHLLKTWASTQTVVALSSGEAEYYGVVNGMCEALGNKGIAKDMGLDFSITLSTDSSAAKGIATRKGLGKVKHLETRTLWAQDKIDEGIVVVKKIGGDRKVPFEPEATFTLGRTPSHRVGGEALIGATAAGKIVKLNS